MININKYLRFFSLFLLISLLGYLNSAISQENVGIGISNPHPSAKLHLADTLGKGFLIPRTDTNAVLAFVNSLTPNPGIANGLLIFQKTDQIFYYWDGDKSHWVPLSGITGPTGAKGQTGLTGPRGPMGDFGFVRDTNFSLLPTDSFGDYTINMIGGTVRKVDRTSLFYQTVLSNGGPPLKLRGRIQGGFMAQASSTALVEQIFDPVNTFKYIPLTGLSIDVPVGFDSIGMVVIRAYGSVRKKNPTNDFNFASFDVRIDGTRVNVQQIVGMGPNGDPPFNQHEQVGWQIAYGTELTSGSHTIEIVGSQYTVGAGTGTVVLCDGPGSMSQAHMSVYVIYSRLP